MAHRLEELFALQAARDLKLKIYRLLSRSSAGRDYPFAHQLRSAASSVEANIAEGYRRSRRDFARFLLIARSSLDEVEVRLRDGADRGHYSAADIELILQQVRLTTTVIMRLRRWLMQVANQ